eukprot:318133-Hanusia_phi.AAC.4
MEREEEEIRTGNHDEQYYRVSRISNQLSNQQVSTLLFLNNAVVIGSVAHREWLAADKVDHIERRLHSGQGLASSIKILRLVDSTCHLHAANHEQH